MLSAPIATHGPNKGFAAVVILTGIAAAWGAYELDPPYALGVAAAFGLPLVWLLSLKLSLFAEGLRYESRLGSKEFGWDEIETFKYAATKQSINFIPVGTYYRFELRTANGQKLSFGNRFERRAELGQSLMRFTYGPLSEKAIALFNSGGTLDFNTVRLSKESGIQVKRWWRFKTIPFSDVQDYALDKGQFYLWRIGEKRVSGLPIGQIPNVFVLLGLLDCIFKRTAASAGGS